MNKYVTEAAGTLLLTFTVGLTSDPIAIGTVLIALIYVCVHKSDAHFNPGVSFAAWAMGKLSLGELAGYLSGQFIGALLAGGFCWWIADISVFSAPDPSVSTIQFISVELIFSLLLILTYIIMIYPATRRKNPVFGVIIGAVFAGCLLISQPIAGTGLNPAVATGFALFDYLNFGNAYQFLPVYILAPCVAGLIASVIHRFLLSGE